MKVAKWLSLAGVTVGTAFLLTACSGLNAGSVNKYSYVYTLDPDTLDYVASSKDTTYDITSNLVDGLFENDRYGNLVPSMAEDWTVSKDGLTYTYKIRKDAKWYTAEGEEYAQVKAQDFVTGLKHGADSKSDSLYLVENSIVGLSDYMEGKTNDFDTVGVKAIDDHTLEYKLNKPESYWNSKTTTGILFPINADFLKSAGKDFGRVKPSGILYNGAYFLKAITSKSSIELEKNPNYWDKDNVKIEQVKLSYYDGSDQESLVRNFESGAYTSARLYPNSSNFPSVQKKYGDNILYSPQDGGIFYYQLNLNRQSYNHTSKQTDVERNATKEALLNKNFRQALNFAFDRTSYTAQANGEKGAKKVLRNTIVPPNFVQVDHKPFGDTVEKKLTDYGDEWKDIDLSDAQDAFYNPTKAKAELEKAKAELQGVQFPIHLDVVVDQTSASLVSAAKSLKQSIEASLGAENVVIDIQQVSTDESNNATFFAETAAQKDYDLEIAGWGPDYQDPSTYLDILDPQSGSVLKNIGLEPKDTDLIERAGLNELKELNDAASKELTDLNARYEKYAAAQAWLTDSSILLPVRSGGANPIVSKKVPFSETYGLVGMKAGVHVYKHMTIQNDVVKASDYEKAYKKWLQEKEKSNDEYQEDLEKHME